MYLASSEKCNALFHLFVFIVYITRSHLHVLNGLLRNNRFYSTLIINVARNHKWLKAPLGS